MKKNSTKTLTLGKIIIYSVGIFGIQLLVGYINTYQSQFYTSVLAADLTKCAVIILIAKIISSLADPIIGNIIDSAHFKSGKMKPFIAMSIIPFALITTLMFVAIDFKNETLKYAYITITTVLWNVVMSFADIPSQGMLAVLSPSSDEKNTCAGIANMLKSLALVAPNLVVPVICMLTGSAVITKKEYIISAIAMGVFAIITTAIMVRGSKEVVKSAPNKMGFKEMFSELVSNKPLMIIFLVNMLGFGRNMAVSIGVQAAAVLLDEVTIPGLGITLAGENLPIILGIGAAIPSTLSVVLTPVISKKLGVKKTFMIFGVYGAIVAMGYYFLFAFGPAWFHSLWGILLGQFVINFMFGPHGFAPLIMLSDSVDYREMTTGKRTEGIQYSVLSLSIKIANAFSVAVGIFIVGLSGYVGTMTFSQVTPHMQNVVMAAYWFIPGLCTGLSMIPMLFYKLDRKEVKQQIQDFIAKRDSVSASK
ncbi:MAG: MFS transporter [Clostridia bacterium]|nr:MFS transporter [Clostridia bacterium]